MVAIAMLHKAAMSTQRRIHADPGRLAYRLLLDHRLESALASNMRRIIL